MSKSRGETQTWECRTRHQPRLVTLDPRAGHLCEDVVVSLVSSLWSGPLGAARTLQIMSLEGVLKI